MISKPRLLICTDWFSPGFKAGGPIKSCVELALALQDEREIFVLTSDRDLGDTAPYPLLEQDKWVSFDRKICVRYCSPKQLRYKAIAKVLQELKPDIVYLNSMFSIPFSLYPLLAYKLGKISTKMVLIPRGMLRPSALAHRGLKKQVFLKAFKMAGLFRKLVFHATDHKEAADIRQQFGQTVPVIEIPPISASSNVFTPVPKEEGELSILFVGRVHPIKNLKFLLECLLEMEGNIKLQVIGAMEDKNYAEECHAIALRLPPSVLVNFLGELPQSKVQQYLEKCHLFALPTKGENYGHAIAEALAAGRPVLISDQTPWSGLSEAKAGWGISLNRPNDFKQALLTALDWSFQEFNTWCQNAKNYYDSKQRSQVILDSYLKMFSTCTL